MSLSGKTFIENGFLHCDKNVSVAQLDRAQASDAWCRWFESNRVHQKSHPSTGWFFGIFSAATIGFEGGAANESERFAYGSQHTDKPKAKDDVDNVGAGRHLDLTKPPIGYTKAKKSY